MAERGHQARVLRIARDRRAQGGEQGACSVEDGRVRVEGERLGVVHGSRRTYHAAPALVARKAAIAPRDSTSETILDALSYSLGALEAATELDVDRSKDDRGFFAAEKAALLPLFDEVQSCEQALAKHLRLKAQVCQARVVLGDAVLDRGVRNAKARMKLELKSSAQSDGADHVFPSDV